MWTRGWRDTVWSELDREWDLIVIGGGIAGAGILREAARLGLRALLVEAQDFASGTSSRSSKLVHGGLRYLRNAQVQTTLASVHERERLLREGKGLVTPLGFLYVTFAGDKLPLWVFGLGMAAYDLLGLRWGHKRYGPDDLHQLTPLLATAGLKGGYRYFDAQTDDARLVLRVIREAVADGGTALNYARAEGLLQRADGQVTGVSLRDMAPGTNGRTAEVKAGVVINATGPRADVLRQEVGGRPRLRCLRGSHLIFPADRLPVTRAITFPHPADQRPVMAIPWEGVTLFGTTDVDHVDTGRLEPNITLDEVDYLMAAVTRAFPALELDQADVQGTFAGVRAVVDTGRTDPSKESREHVLWYENGLLTVSGGKLTTFRIMAHDALRLVRRRIAGNRVPAGRQAARRERVLDELEELFYQPAGLLPAQRLRLHGRYGADTHELLSEAREGELAAIGDSLALWTELRWAARTEGVVHLDDLLLRRVRLGLLLPQGGIPWLDQIRPLVQPELGWDDQRWQAEVETYRRRWREAYHLPGTSAGQPDKIQRRAEPMVG
jgi:glycerol-3-phosphate dehydrogenase